MIKVNVGMSRKVSKDYNSTGFSINLEGEVALSLDDPQLALERIKEFYDIAEETLAQQIESYEASFSGSNDRTASNAASPQVGNKNQNRTELRDSSKEDRRPASGATAVSTASKATNKQLQFLLGLGKRHQMGLKELEEMVDVEFGEGLGFYELSKEQAGSLITTLQQKPVPNAYPVQLSRR